MISVLNHDIGEPLILLVSDGLNEYTTPSRNNEFHKFMITDSIPSDGDGGSKFCKYTTSFTVAVKYEEKKVR